MPRAASRSRVTALLPDRVLWQSERREDARHLAVLRVAKLISDLGETLCLVRNISSGGAMLRIYCNAKLNQTVSVEMKTGQLWTGRVVWHRPPHLGLAFEAPIDVLEFLSSEQRLNSLRPRFPRFQTSRPATIRIGDREHAVSLCDVALGGACFTCADPPIVGTRLLFRIAGLPGRTGEIRWQFCDKAGLAFQAPIPFAEFAAWIADLQSN